MYLTRFFPFVATLRTYNAKDLKADLMAALTVTPVALPQAMAYAVIAGVHPQYGIYACMLPVVVAALWGSSRYMAAGPTNALSMVIFSTLTTVYLGGALIADMPESMRMSYIFELTLLCGLIQVAMGLARLGELANFISHSVMVAFSTGAALLIASGQLNTVLGISGQKVSGFFPQIASAMHNMPHANYWSLSVAALTIILTLVFRRISRRFPAMLAALAVVTCISALLDARQHGVALVGPIPDIVPPLSFPSSLDLNSLRDLFLPAMALAILGTVESLAIGKQLANAKNDTFNGNQELMAQGLGNIAAGLTSGIAGCGSFSRSALTLTSGARTRMSTVFSGLLALPLLLLLAPFISWLPLPALGGILFLISFQMIDVDSIRLCLVATRVDRSVLLLTFAATLLLDLEKAIFIGVFISLVLLIYKTSHPRVHSLERNDILLRNAPPDLPDGVVVYMVEGTLFFGAINELERQLYNSTPSTAAKLIILHLSRVFWIDASGAHALSLFVERCHARSLPIILVIGNTAVRRVLQRTGLLEHLRDGFAPNDIDTALHMAVSLLTKMPQQEKQNGKDTLPSEIATQKNSPEQPDGSR